MDIDEWNEIRKLALSSVSAPNWPSKVKSITIDGLSLIGLDEDLNLYWDGHLIEVKRPLSLTFWQKLGAFITVVSAVVAAGATTYSTYLDAFKVASCP